MDEIISKTGVSEYRAPCTQFKFTGGLSRPIVDIYIPFARSLLLNNEESTIYSNLNEHAFTSSFRKLCQKNAPWGQQCAEMAGAPHEGFYSRFSPQ